MSTLEGPPKAFEFRTLLVYLLFAAGSAAICTQINVSLGVTPNTSIIGVIFAIIAARTIFRQFRSPERQVMLETATSAGGFAGANIALVSLAALYLLDLQTLAVPLFVGVTLGMALDIWLASRLFGSHAFPASAPWPDGEAVGRVIQIGDEGGTMGRHLLQGLGAGIVGRLLGLPMAGIGIAFIGNPSALAALGIGLVVRPFTPLIGWDLTTSYIPHGIMIGAGLVQITQTVPNFSRSISSSPDHTNEAQETPPHIGIRDLVFHLATFTVGAACLFFMAELWQEKTPSAENFSWIIFAGLAAVIHTLIVGYCAMLSGWFPSFAVAIALILIAALLNFPPETLAMLAGYILATGPLFADLGYDLKAGWIVRGRGTKPTSEREGRRQQVWLQQIGGLVGIVTAFMIFGAYWQQELIPPMGRVVATTIDLAVTPSLSKELAGGIFLGIAIQALGGAGRALGVLLSTGLLLDNSIYGWALLVALLIRNKFGKKPMKVRAPGLIAGDGLSGFGEAFVRGVL